MQVFIRLYVQSQIRTDNWFKQVKRSRDAQRKRRQEHEANCKIREAENEKMEEELRAIKSRIQLLVNAVAKPSKISSEDAQEIRKILLEQHEKQTSKSQGSSQTEKSQKSWMHPWKKILELRSNTVYLIFLLPTNVFGLFFIQSFSSQITFNEFYVPCS